MLPVEMNNMSDEVVTPSLLGTPGEAVAQPPVTPDAPIAGEVKGLDATPETVETPETKEAIKIEVPEVYEFKMPEGIQLDAKLAEGFTPIAKKLGLGQEQAQELVDLYASHMAASAVAQQEAQAAARVKQIADWESQTLAMPEFKDNKEAMVFANKAVDKFAPKGMAEWLSAAQTGLGNHPFMVQLFHNLGKLDAEGTPFMGGNAPKKATIYDNSPDLK